MCARQILQPGVAPGAPEGALGAEIMFCHGCAMGFEGIVIVKKGEEGEGAGGEVWSVAVLCAPAAWTGQPSLSEIRWLVPPARASRAHPPAGSLSHLPTRHKKCQLSDR